MNLIKFETPELEAIEKTKAEQIKSIFLPMAEMLETFDTAYNEVIAESEKEITNEVTTKAKRLRLDISKVRTATDKARLAGNESSQREIKARNGAAHILTWAVADKEARLREIEKHFENLEKKRLELLQIARVNMLSEYVEDAGERDLSSMESDVWEAYYKTKKTAYEDRVAAEKKADEERIEKEKREELHNSRKNSILHLWEFVLPELRNIDFSEVEDFEAFVDELKAAKEKHDKEQEEIRLENERLKKEAEAEKKRQEAEQAERDRLAKIEADKAAKIEADRQEALKDEREKARKLENELKLKKEQEEKALKEAEAEKQAELSKGDSAKVEDLISDLEALKKKYAFRSAKNKKMYNTVGFHIDKIINHIEIN